MHAGSSISRKIDKNQQHHAAGLSAAMTHNDPSEMARLLADQWGARSLHYAVDRIQRCQSTGDTEGARHWRQVFDILTQIADETR